jgi:putative transposase
VKNHLESVNLIERKPPRTARRSDAALAVGAELHPLFRKHVPLDAPLTARSVQAIAHATGLQERRIRELAKRYRQNPVAESLASLPKGPKPGSRHAAADVLAAIEGLIDEIYLKMAGPSVAESARQIRGLLIADNGNYRFEPGVVPSERSIARMIAEISAPQRARTRMGSKARSAHEPHPYEYVSKGFLDVVQMDHTPADVILVDSVERRELGRPWVTLLIEVWGRTILGFYVSFGDPSIFRCGRAIANAVLPKVSLLEALGLDATYPMHGLFKRLHADHAAPHRAESFRFACLSYGIDPDVRPRGPPHWGGHIERLIGTLMGKMLLLPGATGSNATKRDGYDAGAAATMTIEEFQRWLIRAICQYHNAPHSALGGLAPAQIWAREAPNHGPLLPPGLDGQTLTRRFLPWAERTVKAYGIEIDRCRYWHASLAPHIGQKIMVHRDERTIREVYPEIDGAFVVAQVVGDCPDVSVAEWKRARKELRKAGLAFQEGSARAETARLIHANHMEVSSAKAKTREARQARKRHEREGVSHARQPAWEGPRQQGTWVSTDELGEDMWLKFP